MVRGLKKKLLIGLLSATVVGTSLAPSVPLVGSFAQEVKADETQTPDSAVYKYTKSTVSPEAATEVFKWSTDGDHYVGNDDDGYSLVETPEAAGITAYKFTELGDENVSENERYSLVGGKYVKAGSGTFKIEGNGISAKDTENSTDAHWPSSVIGKYALSGDEYTPITSDNVNTVLGDPATTHQADVYTREFDTTKSTVKVTSSKDTKATVTPKSIGSTDGGTATIDKNKETKVTVQVTASSGKTIKSVVAKVLDGAGINTLQDNITATKVANAEDLYEFVITATESTINVVVDAEEEKLLITPTLNTTNLSSKVGTAALTSSDPVGTDGEFEVKVTLEDGVTIEKSKLTVTAGDGATVEKTAEKNGVVTYKITPSAVTTDKLEIKVSGRLSNDGLDTKKEDKGSSAEVTPTGNVAADANNVLDVAKSNADKKYVKAILDIKEQTEPDETLARQVNAITTVDTTMKLAGYISIDLYRVENDDSAVIEATSNNDVITKGIKQTTLGSLLTVHYVLPDDAQGKILSGYKVISIHDGKREITTTPNADGEYIEVSGNTLTLHVKKLSDFAILYNTKDATTPDNPDPIKPDDDKPSDEAKPSNGTGTTATTSTTKAATSTTKAAKATTSTKKSSKTSSPKTADYAVNSLLALLTGAAGLFGITLINKKRKEDEE